MNRRELLEFATAASLMSANVAVADSPAASEQAHDHAARITKYGDLVSATSKCVNTAEACLAHCVGQLMDGNTEMKNCTLTSQDVITACTAVREMAARNAPRVAQMAAVCGKICRDCEAECKKHETHKVCRDCRDSCAECAKECEKLAA